MLRERKLDALMAPPLEAELPAKVLWRMSTVDSPNTLIALAWSPCWKRHPSISTAQASPTVMATLLAATGAEVSSGVNPN